MRAWCGPPRPWHPGLRQAGLRQAGLRQAGLRQAAADPPSPRGAPPPKLMPGELGRPVLDEARKPRAWLKSSVLPAASSKRVARKR